MLRIGLAVEAVLDHQEVEDIDNLEVEQDIVVEVDNQAEEDNHNYHLEVVAEDNPDLVVE